MKKELQRPEILTNRCTSLKFVLKLVHLFNDIPHIISIVYSNDEPKFEMETCTYNGVQHADTI